MNLDEAWDDYRRLCKAAGVEPTSRDASRRPEQIPPGYGLFADGYDAVINRPMGRSEVAMWGDDGYSWHAAVSPVALTQTRAELVADLTREGYGFAKYYAHGFSCDECGGAACCPFVYDPYNTNGDCLAEK